MIFAPPPHMEFKTREHGFKEEIMPIKCLATHWKMMFVKILYYNFGLFQITLFTASLKPLNCFTTLGVWVLSNFF